MRTILYDQHCALGAKMVDFCGWEMPIHYQGILHEHAVVRNRVGIFDVSHMGRLSVEGKEAEKFLDYLSTNKITDKSDFSATYTLWLNEKGRCLDDVIIYRLKAFHFFVIVNAGNRAKDLKHLQTQAQNFDVKIKDHYQEEGILAIQGPKAENLVKSLFSEASQLKKMHFVPLTFKGQTLILSRTGYTGEDGFEIYAKNTLIQELWLGFLKEGAEPIGLGARDTLRLEMGYPLYGHELSENIYPHETIANWTIRWNKEFLGKKAIESQLADYHQYGVELIEKGIAREGHQVYKEGHLIGQVTSGTFSPTLSRAIALVFVERALEVGDLVDIQIRQNKVKGKVVKLPFFGGKA
jgi:aminomethyltransferase